VSKSITTNPYARWLPWLAACLIVGLVALFWQPLTSLNSDRLALRAWLEPFGPLAPLVFFILNVIQIVVAPIPGYPVQVLGGILFGPIAGSFYTVGGMTAGGVLAAWLGRRLGRPWLERRMGPGELERWREMAHIDSFWTWWVILLIPLGDIPYFFAGLSRIRLTTLALAILTSRGPFTVLIVLMGDRVLDLPLTWLALLIAGIGLVIILGFSQSERLERWGRAYITYVAGKKKPTAGQPVPAPEDGRHDGLS
jgi:uncharacterized membrane protein YdjX (TVP38/TMEM64 family)